MPSVRTRVRRIRTSAAARSSAATAPCTRRCALPNTTDEGPRRRFLVRPDDYRAAERRRARAGPRPARVLPLASGSPRAAVAVRPRSRVAVLLLRHRLGDRRRHRRADVVAPPRRPHARSTRNLSIVRQMTRPARPIARTASPETVDHVQSRAHPHTAPPVHRQAGRRRGLGRHRRRAARRPHASVRRAEEAPLHRRGPAAELRQHLRQRRGHPLPAEGADAGQATATRSASSRRWREAAAPQSTRSCRR